MENKRDSIVGSIKEAREKGVKEELILKE